MPAATTTAAATDFLLTKFNFADHTTRSLAAEIGLCLNHAGASAGGAPELSGDTTDGSATVGAGYRRGALDGRLGLRIIDLANAGKTTAVGASIGYIFW